GRLSLYAAFTWIRVAVGCMHVLGTESKCQQARGNTLERRHCIEQLEYERRFPLLRRIEDRLDYPVLHHELQSLRHSRGPDSSVLHCLQIGRAQPALPK